MPETDKNKVKEINKVSILTLGCSRNVVDSENIIGKLEANNFQYTENADDSDTLIINTCGFIQPAKEESIQVILDAVEMKRRGKLKQLIVTGCLSQRNDTDLRRQIPEVDYFFGVASEEKILKVLSGDRKYTLLGERSLLTPIHYAYLKISEGCNHKCSFCAIPLMRGRHETRPIEELAAEVKGLAERGSREIVMIAEDSTYYGKDLYNERKLPELMRAISDIPGVDWIRLMYAYPTNFPWEALEVIAEKENFCNYIDIPLQHASDKILKSMKRGTDRAYIEEILGRIRNSIPNAHIRSTFIVGYPGETDADFNELIEFLKEQQLDRVGVFKYSREEDTSAYILGDPVSDDVKQAREEEFMLTQQAISLEKNKRKVGKRMKVIIDEMNDGYYTGRTEYDAPEVDNTVKINSDIPLRPGDFAEVTIESAGEYDLYGNAEKRILASLKK